MNEFLENHIRQKICNLLAQNPGLHLHKISERLNIPISVVEIHLNTLEKENIITVTTTDGYKRYYHETQSDKDSDGASIETRQKIYAVILKNPGLHQAKIAQMLFMRKSLAEYHLNFLEKNDAVIAVKESGYKRYYVKDSDVGQDDMQMLALIRQKIPFQIVSLLIQHPILQHKDIGERLGISPSTLSYHLNKLVTQRIIDIQRYGDEKGYVLKNKKELMRFLVRYEMQNTIDSFKDLWDDFV
jgi:predicted transcriptional regulator